MLKDGLFDINLPQPSASGNVLTSDGDNWLSQAPAGGGSMNLIQSVTLSNGDGTATVTGMDSTYDRYVIMGSQIRMQSSASQILVKREVAGAYAMNSRYSQFNFQSNTSSVSTGNQNGSNQTFVRIATSLDSTNANSTTMFEFYVDKPSDTLLNKLYSYDLRSVIATDPYVKQSTGVVYDQITSAVTGIRFYPNAGTFLSGAIRLYGISNS